MEKEDVIKGVGSLMFPMLAVEHTPYFRGVDKRTSLSRHLVGNIATLTRKARGFHALREFQDFGEDTFSA
jgi:hypothetical protein